MNKISRHTEIALQFDERATTRQIITNHNNVRSLRDTREECAKYTRSFGGFQFFEMITATPRVYDIQGSSQHSKKRKQEINVGLDSWNRLVLCSSSSFSKFYSKCVYDFILHNFLEPSFSRQSTTLSYFKYV